MTELGLVVVVAGAFFVQTVTGFGSTVLALIFGSLLIPVEQLVPVLLLVDLPLASFLALRGRAHVDRAVLLGTVLPWMGLGVVVGVSVAPWLGGPSLRRVYGALVVGLVLRELAGGAPARSVGAVRAWTAAAGVVHGLWGSGGPLLVQAVGPVLVDRARFRATLCAVWALFDAVVLATLLARGEVDPVVLRRALLVAPVLPLAILAGDRLHARLPEAPFRALVRGLLVLGGLVLCLRPE